MTRTVTERDLRMPEFRDVDDLEALEFRADGKIVRKDRWEKAIFKIVGVVGWSRRDFELDDLVDEVRTISRASRVGWHSVEEFGFPDDGEDVLFCSYSRNLSGMLIVKMLIGEFSDGRWRSGDQEVLNVTHWAKLPPLPPDES